MQREIFKQLKQGFTSSILTKYGALFLLLVISIAVVACGASDESSVTAAATPSPTAAPIHLYNDNLSPTPSVAPYLCGIWITDPTIAAGNTFTVYGKFSRNDNGNPTGMAGGTVTLTIQWGDGSTYPASASISATGLASVPVSSVGHSAAINKLSLITATFTSGNTTCQVGNDRPASFTLTTGVAPKPTTTTTTSPPTGGNGGGGNGGAPGLPGFPGLPGRKHG